MVVFPPFRLDTDEGRLWNGETLLVLRRKPFAILSYLAAHPGKLVTQDELLAKVWHGAVVSDSAVRSHLHELRQVLGERVIETVIGRGYRFVAELRDDVVVRAAPDVGEIAPADPLVVGRDAELELLRGALERAREGHRQMCFVTGKPGIGKSTLVRTFLSGLDPRTVIIARGACFEQHGTPEPYLAIIEALAALTRSGRSAQTLVALVRYAPTFVTQLPHLVSDEQLAQVMRRAAGGNESRQLRELSEALEALCSQEPLVLVLEDLQWSDVATIDLLSLLGQRQERAKLLVLGTSRHAEIQSPDHPLNRVLRSLVARAGALVIQVPKIGVAAVQSFIDRRFVGHAFPPQLTDLVAENTGGTPLFMVSLLDELAGRGMLAEREGRFCLTVSIGEVHAHRPASIKQLLDMQLDRLSATEQRVLEAASIVGAEFSTSLVAAALELSVEQVDDMCDALVRRSLFLHVEPDDRYGVNHALVQEVCVERSSPVRRRRWHRLVAEALERDPRAGELSHLLAKHFDAAGDPARALPAYAAAGRHAAQRNATSDAIALCTRALELLPRLPAGRERDLLELEILGTMCQQVSSNTFSAAFAGREPLAVYTRAIEIARSLGEAPRLYRAITQLCNYNMIIAEYDRSAELTAELRRIEEEHALEPNLLHGGIFARAYIAFFSADLGSALSLLERLAPAEDEESVFRGNLPGRALAVGHLACVRWVVGEPERALAEANATIDLAARLEIPILQALGHVVRARLRYLRRDPLSIVEPEVLHAVRAAALDLGLLTEARAFALWVEAQRGPLTLATIEPLLDGLRQRLKEVSTCSTLIAQVLIDVLRVSGHLAEARKLTDEIIAFAVAHNERVYLPELLRMRGELCEGTDPTAAGRDYREAIELARATGARSLEQRASDSLTALVS
ncbi:MAG TPA: AAA family ATPase [Polyangiaceae bacterium]|jgi:DNA-binding winged helix-turn-helix (wHTH) protein|nr:AAA family ATPase [Polyangiaceae bacterium]